MGREIRQVPPNWEHPKNDRGNYKPLFDQPFSEAVAEWKKGYNEWENGSEEALKYPNLEYWDWYGLPPDDPEMYLPEGLPEKTWYQVYETVTEGSPTTPPFPTKEELIRFLSTQKDLYGLGPLSEKAATRFVESGWVPSFAVFGNNVYQGAEMHDIDKGEQP